MKTMNGHHLRNPMEFDIDPESGMRAINISMGKEIPQDLNPEESDTDINNINDIYSKNLSETPSPGNSKSVEKKNLLNIIRCELKDIFL